MKSNWPEYIIEGENKKCLEVCQHPRDVFFFLTNPNKPSPSYVSVLEYDKETCRLVEHLNGEDWLKTYCVLEPAKWRMR